MFRRRPIPTRWGNPPFLDGLARFGQHKKKWVRIAELVKTRTSVQVNSHAQKHREKLARQGAPSPPAVPAPSLPASNSAPPPAVATPPSHAAASPPQLAAPPPSPSPSKRKIQASSPPSKRRRAFADATNATAP